MKIKLNKILAFSLLVILASCTKVIDVDLNEANQRIVIDGAISYSDYDSTHLHTFVKLTRTGSYYTSNEFDTISDANLFINDKAGNTYHLDYYGKGQFMKILIPMGSSFDEYELSGSIEGTEISSKSILPQMVKIDSIGAYALGFGPHGKDHLTAVCFFTDIPNEKNYYRLRIHVNKAYYSSLYISRDDGQDGDQIAFPFFQIPIKPLDTINIELLTMDEASFEYYKVLSQNIGGGGFSAAPGNPVSNIEGDAIGVFTAETSSRMEYIAK